MLLLLLPPLGPMAGVPYLVSTAGPFESLSPNIEVEHRNTLVMKTVSVFLPL